MIPSTIIELRNIEVAVAAALCCTIYCHKFLAALLCGLVQLQALELGTSCGGSLGCRTSAPPGWTDHPVCSYLLSFRACACAFLTCLTGLSVVLCVAGTVELQTFSESPCSGLQKDPCASILPLWAHSVLFWCVNCFSWHFRVDSEYSSLVQCL